ARSPHVVEKTHPAKSERRREERVRLHWVRTCGIDTANQNSDGQREKTQNEGEKKSKTLMEGKQTHRRSLPLTLLVQALQVEPQRNGRTARRARVASASDDGGRDRSRR